METNATANPQATLRSALRPLGFTLSGDFDAIWNSLLRRTRDVVGNPTNREMALVVNAWIAWTEELRAANRPGDAHACYLMIIRALNGAALSGGSNV